METTVTKLYEAMFLVGSAEATADWEGINTAIKNILERAGAEIVSIRKWDDRKLAYEINGKDRGTYILCYFRVEGGKVREIERDVQLSEQIMRVLILCAEHRGEEDIEKETPAVKAEKQKQKAAKAAVKKAEAEQPPALQEPPPKQLRPSREGGSFGGGATKQDKEEDFE